MPSGHNSDPGLAGKARGDLLNALGVFSIAAAFNKPDLACWIFGGLVVIGIIFLVAGLLAYFRKPEFVFRVKRPNANSRLGASMVFSFAIIATAGTMLVLSLKLPELLSLFWSIYGLLVGLMIVAQIAFLSTTRRGEIGFWPTIICTSSLAAVTVVFSVAAILVAVLIERFPDESEPGQVVLAGFMVATPAIFWILIEFTNIVVSGINIKNNEHPYISTFSIIKSLFQIVAGGALVAGIWINWWTIIAFWVAVLGTFLGMFVGIAAYLTKPHIIEAAETEITPSEERAPLRRRAQTEIAQKREPSRRRTF